MSANIVTAALDVSDDMIDGGRGQPPVPDRIREEVGRAYVSMLRAAREISEISANDFEAHARMAAYCGALRVAVRSMLEKLDSGACEYANKVEGCYGGDRGRS